MELLKRNLLAALAVAVLCASLAPSVHPLPLSGTGSATRPESHTATDKRSGSVERLPRNTEDQEDSGAAHNGSEGENATIVDDLIQRCLEECYYSRVPQELIRRMKSINYDRFGWNGVHPSFMLAEWLEDYHRQKFCKERSNQICEDASSRQKTSDIVNSVATVIQTTLGYNVTFNENYYPRYIVKIPCSHNISSDIKPKHLEYYEGSWELITNNIDCF